MGQDQSLAWQDIPDSSKDEFESQRGTQSLEHSEPRAKAREDWQRGKV